MSSSSSFGRQAVYAVSCGVTIPLRMVQGGARFHNAIQTAKLLYKGTFQVIALVRM